MKVTFVYMVMCGGGEPAVMQIARGTLSKRGSFRIQSFVCTETVATVEGSHKLLAAKHETTEYPAWFKVVPA